MNYGLPYKGSKNKIAKWVVSHLPSADCLVDVFAGGCAITHCALLSGKYKKVIANDLENYPAFFKECCEGKHKGENRWISREDFLRTKDADPYASICFSFGNNLKNYLYSKELEPYKKALHEMCYATTPFEVKRKFRTVVTRLNELWGDYSLGSLESLQSLERLERLERLESLESLERLERLESLERLERLEIRQSVYKSLDIPENSIIYCDPPYKNTAKYKHDINHDEFYQWALSQKSPVFISNYEMPSDFVCIAEKQKTCCFSKINNKLNTTEKIFIPKHQA